MLEREKQRSDQQMKHATEEKQSRSKKDGKKKVGQQAGSDTNPETMKDKDYVKRIEEKTKKH
jgi:hypothetical protein